MLQEFNEAFPDMIYKEDKSFEVVLNRICSSAKKCIMLIIHITLDKNNETSGWSDKKNNFIPKLLLL